MPGLDRAIALLEAAARTKPDDFELNVKLIAARLRKGDSREAASRFVALVEARPEWTQLHYDVLESLAREGQAQPMFDALRAALQAAPAHPVLLYGAGLLLQVVAQSDEAQTYLEQAAAANPSFAAVHHNLAIVYSTAGDKQAAIAAARRAIEQSATIAEPHYSLGAWLLGEDNSAAVRHFKRFVELHYPHLDRFVPQAAFSIEMINGTSRSSRGSDRR